MKSIINEESINKCLEYVEDESKESFKEIVKGLNVSVSDPEYRKYFPEDKESRNVYKVTLKKNGHQATMTFGQSIFKTMDNEDPSLYDILTTIGSELTMEDESFEEFCSEFGYDSDSRKAEKQFKGLQKQNRRLSKVISKTEAYNMPK